MHPYRSAVLAAALMLAAPSGHAQDDTATWVFDTHTPGLCSPNGGLHGGCPPGRTRAHSRRHRRTRACAALAPDVPSRRQRHARDRVAGPLAYRSRRPSSIPHRSPAGPTTRYALTACGRSFCIRTSRTTGCCICPTSSRETTAQPSRSPAHDFDGAALSAVEDVFVADAWGSGATAGRAEFGPDGMLYLTVGDRDAGNTTDDASYRMLAQGLDNHVGKVLRLRDDGSAPEDNPFFGRGDAKPEIFSYGHRNAQGLAWHPETGELWATEIGPMAGDELNRLIPGGNYGWPLVSLGKIYNSSLASEQPWWRPGIEMPVMFWAPAISPSSLMIYDGDRFPLWRGHYFIGGLSGQQLQRVAFDQPPPQTERRESMLIPLDARVRDVRQGPDGYIYIAVERDLQSGPGSARLTPNGSILRIEPAERITKRKARCDDGESCLCSAPY